jgi:hypothetical protein
MNVKYLTSAVLTILIAGIAVIVLAVGGGSAKTRPLQTAAAGSAVSIRTTSLGKTLVDANGRTLYLFAGDRTNVSTLSGAGLSVWPRFIATGHVKGLNGAQAAKIGTITSPSDVQRAPTLLLRGRLHAGQHPRSGPESVRRPVVCPRTRRHRRDKLPEPLNRRTGNVLAQLRLLRST